MPRAPTHRYVDPLDQVWLGAAQRVGLTVARSGEVYAHSNGQGTLFLGEANTLDPDDGLAQMIFHELCHAMVEHPGSLARPDWGLDNTSPKDLVHEHACLRLQAKLSGEVGLRRYMAATTVFRRYYDRLPEDPMSPKDDEAVKLAQRGLRASRSPPFSPHVQNALKASALIIEQASAFVEPPRPGELASLNGLLDQDE